MQQLPISFHDLEEQIKATPSIFLDFLRSLEGTKRASAPLNKTADFLDHETDKDPKDGNIVAVHDPLHPENKGVYIHETADKSSMFIPVGDIHGNYTKLQELLEQSHFFTNPNVKLVFLGDYIDRSTPEDSLKTLKTILYLQKLYPNRVVALRGNHDHNLGDSLLEIHMERLKLLEQHFSEEQITAELGSMMGYTLYQALQTEINASLIPYPTNKKIREKK
jgi:hypothetical protein